MSYELRIVGDAIADLRELDPWLQEEVLGALEALAEDPTTLITDRHGEAAHDFERGSGANRHIVFLRLHRDKANTKLTVLGIGARSRPWEGR